MRVLTLKEPFATLISKKSKQQGQEVGEASTVGNYIYMLELKNQSIHTKNDDFKKMQINMSIIDQVILFANVS